MTTANYWLRTWKSFVRWLMDRGNLERNPFQSLRPVPADPQRKRRAISPEDFAKLLDTTSKSKRTYRRLSGRDRALLYETAAATGLRAGELASLTRESIQAGCVVLPPRATKNRQGARLPLPKDLLNRLSKRKGQLFPGPWRWDASRMLQRDLAEAGLAFRAHGRVYDFHALRLQFITGLARAGVPLQLAQKLARHSTPNLTSTVYTQLEEVEMRAAVEKAHG